MIGSTAPRAILSTAAAAPTAAAPTVTAIDEVPTDDSDPVFYEAGIDYVTVDLLHGDGNHAFASNHVDLVQHMLPSDATLLIFPGSFNPLHGGHMELVNHAKQVILDKGLVTGGEGNIFAAFELTAVNADKPALTEEQIDRRTMQFFDAQWQQQLKSSFGNCFLLLTKVPLFAQKAQLFARRDGGTSYFVIGADTARRIVDRKYYDDSDSKMVRVLSDFYSRYNIRFIVGGRLDKELGRFVTMRDLIDDGRIPVGFEDLFLQIPEQQFRKDISSTEIRARSGKTM